METAYALSSGPLIWVLLPFIAWVFGIVLTILGFKQNSRIKKIIGLILSILFLIYFILGGMALWIVSHIH